MIWDPIECIPSMYLDFVLFWPDDGCLQPKYVAEKKWSVPVRLLKVKQLQNLFHFSWP